MIYRAVFCTLVVIVLGLDLMITPCASAQVATSPDAVHPLLIGSLVPQLTLSTPEGKPFDLNAAITERPTILIFYRGGW